ncbi:MAG: PQQ-dependent sugar dehydrogenase [Ignavibacteria bacterium]|nr:PQQ-dependent sugar dehydrogenase [Ignavibacteria bacterium]
MNTTYTQFNSQLRFIALNLLSLCVLLVCASHSCFAQKFKRSELPTLLSTPWEVTYGPDNFLWATESGGTVSRIHAVTGEKQIVFTASDFFPGSPKEQSTLCIKPKIAFGTLGLALHPNFLDEATSFIYYLYSYNSGSVDTPATRFKIKRLTWDAASSTVTSDSDIVLSITTGYDHVGGRMMIIHQESIPYIFLTIGDNGISDKNYPTCYEPQSTNPNNFTQDPTTQNGKIHRFNLDGTIPATNPLAGNSFYTRGHRNPQGLIYNPTHNLIYTIEHGDRSDDEINILHKGMNYGWKNVRGYHADNNYPGEAEFVNNYKPDPRIPGDSLVEPFYSFCASPSQDTSSDGANWCSIAPSDGIYYGSPGIPEWTNSLLIVTLKDGVTTNPELYQVKLLPDGSYAPSSSQNPNPNRFFGSDQALNGRLRDIAVSPDGRTIYLVNNYGGDRDKITVYTYDTSAIGVDEPGVREEFSVYPNPANEYSQVEYILASPAVVSISISNLFGQEVKVLEEGLQAAGRHVRNIETSGLASGVYVLHLKTKSKLIGYQKLIILE